MNLQRLKYFGLFVLGAILFYIVFTKIPFSKVINSLTGVTPGVILWFCLASLGVMLCLVARWQVILIARGHQVPFWRLFTYKIIGFSTSYVAPMPNVAGDPVRAGMLGRHGINMNDGASTVLIDKTIELSLSLVFFLGGLAIILTPLAVPATLKATVYIATFIVLLLVFFFYYRMLKGQNFFFSFYRLLGLHHKKKLRKVGIALELMERKMVGFYRRSKGYFLAAAFFTALAWMFMFMEYESLARMVGISLGMKEIFLVFSMMGLSTLAPVPMSLGVQEAGQVGVFAILRQASGAGLALSLVIRARDILWSIIGFSFLIYYQVTSHTFSVKIPKKWMIWKRKKRL